MQFGVILFWLNTADADKHRPLDLNFCAIKPTPIFYQIKGRLTIKWDNFRFFMPKDPIAVF